MSKRTGKLNLFKWDTTDSQDLASNFDVDTALNENWDKIDEFARDIDNTKQDAEDGKGLSTEDYTTAEKTKLAGVATGAQVNVIENLTLGGTALTKNNKTIEIKDSEVTNARTSTANSKTYSNVKARLEQIETDLNTCESVNESQANTIAGHTTSINANTTEITNAKSSNVKGVSYGSVDARLEDIEADIQSIQENGGHVYGIRRLINSNSSATWERILDSVGKVANATKNGGTVQNDFDNLAPWSEIKSCNYDLTTKKINAWFGDANFAFDGSNGDVFTHVPKTYWKIYQANGYDYVLLSDYARSGFMEIDGFFVGRYNGSVVADDGLLHTYSGLVPTTNKTIGAFRTLAQALGDNFSQLDWRYFVLQMLYLVEYANYNSQSMLGNGVMSRKYLKTLVAESNTNRVIISSSSGYYVGQIIRIGTSYGGSQVADARKITAIDSYSENGVTGVALTFDGTAVNIAVDNFVCTMAQITGQCDELGMKSGCLNNDGYHSVIYRGVENLFANIWQWVDGINIKDNLAYICKDHSKYVSDKFDGDYKPLAYTNATTNGYAKTLGLDVDEPFFRFPTEIGGGSSTYMSDYYYQNTGNRVARVGGPFSGGASDGLWSWNLDSASSDADWSIGCRVLIDNQ